MELIVSLYTDLHLTASRDNPIYTDSTTALQTKFRRISGFFADVVLRFVLQDLSLLLVSPLFRNTSSQSLTPCSVKTDTRERSPLNGSGMIIKHVPRIIRIGTPVSFSIEASTKIQIPV